MKSNVKSFLFISGWMCVICFSCEHKPKSSPDLLSKDKMIDVLVDVSLAEASTFTRSGAKSYDDQLIATKYEDIMQQHQITYAQFSETFNYYTDHPDSMASIMQEVENRLSMLHSKSQAHSKPLNQADSAKVLKREP